MKLQPHFSPFLLQSWYTKYEIQFHIDFAKIEFHREICTENEIAGVGHPRTRAIQRYTM